MQELSKYQLDILSDDMAVSLWRLIARAGFLPVLKSAGSVIEFVCARSIFSYIYADVLSAGVWRLWCAGSDFGMVMPDSAAVSMDASLDDLYQLAPASVDCFLCNNASGWVNFGSPVFAAAVERALSPGGFVAVSSLAPASLRPAPSLMLCRRESFVFAPSDDFLLYPELSVYVKN